MFDLDKSSLLEQEQMTTEYFYISDCESLLARMSRNSQASQGSGAPPEGLNQVKLTKDTMAEID